EAPEQPAFGHRDHRVHGDERARPEARRHQPRPRLPRPRRAGGRGAGGGRGAARRAQPIPAHARGAGAAPSRGPPQPALLRHRGRPGRGGGCHVRRHGSDHRLPDGGFGPRRRVRADRAALRHLPAGGEAARRRAEAGALAAAEVGAAARRAGRRLRAAHQGRAAQLAHEPDRQGVHRRRAGLRRRPGGAARLLCGVRRGVRAPDLRRLAPHAADGAAGDAGAVHAGRQRREDLQPDGLEGGLRHLRPEPGAERGQGAPEPHLHHRAQPPARGGGGADERGRLLPRHLDGVAGEARRPGRGAGGSRLRRAADAGLLLHHRRLPADRLRGRRCLLLPDADGGGGRHRHPRFRLLRRPGARPEPLRPLRLLQERGGAGSGAGPAARLDRGARPCVDGGGRL
ncbi:MAG: Glutamine-dependent 2-keto-4-methylthiobutyrate transaminase / Aspartate/tyrosine/aromatic aminotransferase, partial [uncultured Acetobacteraceae bacterium]